MIVQFKDGDRILAVTLPDGAKQLVSSDADGNKLFVGDKVIVKSEWGEREYTVRLEAFATADNGCYLTPKQLHKARRKSP